MRKAMERKGWDLRRLSQKTGASTGLLRLVLEGGVTHPNIALRIGNALGLTEAQTLQMMPERYRAAQLPLKPMEGMEFDGGRPLRMKDGTREGGAPGKRRWSIKK